MEPYHFESFNLIKRCEKYMLEDKKINFVEYSKLNYVRLNSWQFFSAKEFFSPSFNNSKKNQVKSY